MCHSVSVVYHLRELAVLDLLRLQVKVVRNNLLSLRVNNLNPVIELSYPKMGVRFL